MCRSALLLCVCCCIVILGAIFVPLFFIAVVASVPKDSVHNVLQDVFISNLQLQQPQQQQQKMQQQQQLNATVLFTIWSRNSNHKLAVRVSHLRIALIYHGMELGRAYIHTPFLHPPRNISQLQAPLQISGLPLPDRIAQLLRSDMDAGFVQLRIKVKERAAYRRADKSWQTKIGGKGNLRCDDKCGLNVTLAAAAGNTLHSRQCGWTLASYTESSG